MRALISIIVPVYNAEKHLRGCLDSVITQTASQWICICVDDGSTDSSALILEEYAARDPRVQVIHQQNAGPGSARNSGLAAVKTPYFMFVDADDILHSETIGILAAEIDENIDSLSFGSATTLDDLSEKGRVTVYEDPIIWVREYRDWWKYGVVWGRLWKTSLVGDIRFNDFKNGEDTIWCNYALARCKREKELSHKLYFYRPFNGLSKSKSAWLAPLVSMRFLYDADSRLARYNGKMAWLLLRTHYSLRTVCALRKNFHSGVVSLESLSRVKRLLLSLVTLTWRMR